MAEISPAVFFDRDGTLMEEVGYCRSPEQVKVFPGVPEALGRLREAGFKVIIITNQSGIARGYLTSKDFLDVQAELLQQLNAEVDGVYFSPDSPFEESATRKPAPGLVLQAAEQHGIDLSRSYFVGDKASDILCGKLAGTQTILVLTGYGSSRHEANPDFTAKDAVEAVKLILSRFRGSGAA